MDNKKSQTSSSSSSLTSQLFGSHESSSNDVLSSIFPPSKGIGRYSTYSEARGSCQKESSGNQPWNNKQDNVYKHIDTSYGSSAKKEKGSIYEQEGPEPCNLSNSIYYGGRETYSKSTTNPSSTSYPMYAKKDGGEDHPGGASRGNWWQGSLYY
ncbi:uncharacterized protein LOC130814061 [Amaranthus tricolor]|uniref:uncharacterized protein LOC130814061 n=1 Tax=Amaranthus tricolor TaxID=29722 RepID=UPI00258C3B15|nr:uncharacterized protein LOC130814061 [Amaranthus tricolor]